MPKPLATLKGASYRLSDGTELPLTVRLSSRSRYLRLRLSAQQGLIVSAPKRTARQDIEAFLQQQQRWLARHWLTLGPEYLRHQTEQRQLPRQILLPGLGELWRVVLEDSDAAPSLAEDSDEDVLILSGALEDNPQAGRELLQRWLQQRAKRYLPLWLARLAERHGFRYRSVSVRNQRGRWGSCSARGTISLNCKLLLLPSDQATHVILHELCHTVYLNHGPRFWQLLRRVDPATDDLQPVIDEAWLALPGWCR